MHSEAFFHAKESKIVHAGHRRASWLRRFLFLLFGVIVLWFCVTLVAGAVVWTSLVHAQEAIAKTKEAFSLAQIEQAQEHLALVQSSISRAKRGFVFLRPVEILPVVGPYVQSARTVAQTGDQIVEVFVEVTSLADELIRLSGFSKEQVAHMLGGLDTGLSVNDIPEETKQVLLARLSGSAALFERTLAQIDISLRRLNRLALKESFGLQGELRAMIRELETAKEGISLLAAGARIVPVFAGLSSETTYLLLFLNNAELRPGGGFIGTYGLVTTASGEFVRLLTQDVYAIDDAAAHALTEPASEVLARYNAADRAFLRDSNWSPDFAVSSQAVMDQYLKEAAVLSPTLQAQIAPTTEIDGVVGFTPDYAAALLEITGPQSVGGQTFTSKNVFDLLEYQVEFGFAGEGIPVAQRKEILAQLVVRLKESLLSLPLSDWRRVIEVTHQAGTRKQLVFFSPHVQTQQLFERYGFAGRVNPGVTDVQLVVDANLASLKSDPVVERTIHYEIEKNSAGQYVGRTTVRYDHHGGFDWKTTRYRTYTRLYVPRGSQWVRTIGSLANDKRQNPTQDEGTTDIAEDLGMTSFGTFVAIEPGASRTLVFEYLLAPSVVELIRSGEYRLQAIKQIGAGNHTLTLTLDFDKNLTSASVPEAPDQWGDDVYRLSTSLHQDREFVVEL